MTGAALRLLDRRPAQLLAVIVALAVIVRFVLALGSDTPWIFADEYIYSELARSLVENHDLLLRGGRVWLSELVPLVDAPGYLMGDTSTAYVWIKFVNSVAMCAAAFPAYALARLALGVRLSFAFAILVLAWPAYAYTATVMTEPLFFVVVITFVWALARALVRPTFLTQALVAVLFAAAMLVRLQSVVLLVSVPLACLLVVLLGPGAPGLAAAVRRLRSYWPLLALGIGVPILALAAQTARGHSVRNLVSSYGDVQARAGLDVVLHWSAWHVAVVALSLGVVPLALALGTWTRALTRRSEDVAVLAVLVTCLAVTVPVLIQVTVFAANISLRVEERNLFVIEPLILLVALVGAAMAGWHRIVAVGGAVLLALALADLPVTNLLVPQPPYSETFSLLSLMDTARTTGVAATTLAIVAGLAGIVLTAVAVLGPRKVVAVAMPGLVLALLLIMNDQITPMLRDYSDRVAAATVPQPADWIDRAVPGTGSVLYIGSNEDPGTLVWQTEFWNESIGPVMAVGGPFPALNGAVATIDPGTGRFVPPPGATIPEAEYVVAPRRWQLAGTQVAEAASLSSAMTLWRVQGPPRLSQTVDGLYADGWTGPVMTVRRFGCDSGTFVLSLRSGFGRDRLVTLTSGTVERRVRLRQGGDRTFRVPARPDPATGACVLTVTPADTATGVELGNPADPRELGLQSAPPGFEAAS